MICFRWVKAIGGTGQITSFRLLVDGVYIDLCAQTKGRQLHPLRFPHVADLMRAVTADANSPANNGSNRIVSAQPIIFHVQNLARVLTHQITNGPNTFDALCKFAPRYDHNWQNAAHSS